jgi:hypothetical protein
VIAIKDSEWMTIKESPELGTADRDEFGMAIAVRSEQKSAGRWT